MDFLLLLPACVRVVIEVDGKHHYADQSGRADPGRCGSMASADRDLRLAGYEVYRFGAEELISEARSLKVVKDFFDSLFKKFGIPIPR